MKKFLETFGGRGGGGGGGRGGPGAGRPGGPGARPGGPGRERQVRFDQTRPGFFQRVVAGARRAGAAIRRRLGGG